MKYLSSTLMLLQLVILHANDYSMNFDGDDYVTIPHSSSFQNNTISISIWVYLDNAPSGSESYLLFKGTDTGAPYTDRYWGLRLSGGSNMYVEGEFVISGSYHIISSNNVSLVTDTWHHILLTYNGSEIKLIIDSDEVNSLSVNGSLSSGSDDVLLGYMPPQNTFLEGYLDEVSIWDRAISEEEVANLLSTELTGTENDLVAYWNFNEGTGEMVTDQSNNGNDGSIYGATWSTNVFNDFLIINVPGDYLTIQEAIDASNNGDIINVSEGTYYENINFNGKNIHLSGENPTNTIIDGGSDNSLPTIKLHNFTYSSDTHISGFTVRNFGNDGISILDGGAPKISNCILNEITGSSSGAIYIAGDFTGSSVTVERCLVYGNSTNSDQGGGIRVASNNGSASAVIINCTITQNSPEGIKVHGSGTNVEVVNSIIFNNSIENLTNEGILDISYSLVNNFAGEGVINLDPLFVNPDNGNFTLQPSSPCIDAGDPNSPLDPDGSVSDMGTYPYQMTEPQYPNHSLSFDGNDYVSINSNNDILTSNNGVSINLYFKKQDFSGHQFLYDWGVYSGANVTDAFRMKIDNGGILETWVEGNDNYSSPGFSYNLNDHETNLLNTWVQVTVVYGMNTTKLYLNGSLVNEATNNMSENAEYRIFDQSGAWYWIGDQGDNQYGFNGLIDEFSIWSKEFSDSDVQSIQNASFHYGEEHLVGYWTFNESEGNLVHDHSGNGYDGTVNGATWSDDGAPVMPASIASVEVGTVQGYPNSEISVPVHIDLMQESVSSIEISFSEFQDHMEFIDLELEGALVGDAEWDVVLNSQEDLLLTLSYGANEISGEGVLFHLTFNIPEEIDTDFVPVMVEHVHLDELEGDIEILNGGVEINAIVWGDVSQNGDVSGYDASLILKYLVGTEELDENQLYVADVTQDATISALDASTIAQYVVQLIDDLPLDDPASVSGGGEFYVNDTELIPGEMLEIPIELASGENLLSFEFSAEYDESVFTLEEVVWSDLIDHFSIEENLVPGSINIAGMGTTPDGEEGTFGTIRLYVNPDFSDQNTSVNMSYRINESVPVENFNVVITNSTLALDNSLTPKVFALHQNYPNPFNPITQIKYDIAEDSFVSITIFDVMGRNIRTLMNVNQNAGYHSIHWDAKNDIGEGVSAGMYIYTIQAGEFRSTKKMVLLK